MLARLLAAVGLERRDASSAWFGAAWLHARGAEVRGEGAPVTPRTALGVPACYAAVGLLAESCASLPLHVFRRLPGGGRERERDHWLARLAEEPAPGLTAFEWVEGLVASTALTGNGFAELVEDAAGRVVAMPLLHPSRVTPFRTKGGEVAFAVEPPEPAGGPRRVLLDGQVLWVRNRPGPDGLRGLSPVESCRGAFAAAVAEQTFHTASFRSTRPGGVLQSAKRLSPEAKDSLAKQWAENFGGPDQAGKTAVLEEGVEFKPLLLSNEDRQFIEARKFTVEEIARIYRVPPFLIGSLDSANYANSRQAMQLFVTLTLRTWTRRVEQALERALLTPRLRAGYFLEFGMQELLRGTEKERAEVYEIAVRGGWLDVDEVRRLENLAPREPPAVGVAG